MGLKHIGLFDVLLLRANWKTGYFQGEEIKPGSLGISISTLAETLNEDRRSVRAILDALASFGMITRVNKANRWTHITICNWDTYQQSGEDDMPTDVQPSDQPTVQPSDQPSDQPTVLDIRSKEEDKDIKPTHYPPEFESFIFKTLGGSYHANVTEWLSTHSEERIKQAIVQAEASGKLNVSYIKAILSQWAKDGYPKAKGKPNAGNSSGRVQTNIWEDDGRYDNIGVTIESL
jgi:DnaD/phage-associated family protein